MATEVVRVTCDRCNNVLVVKPITMHCVTHKLRDASPQSQLELCPRCFLAMLQWLREPPPK